MINIITKKKHMQISLETPAVTRTQYNVSKILLKM